MIEQKKFIGLFLAVVLLIALAVGFQLSFLKRGQAGTGLPSAVPSQPAKEKVLPASFWLEVTSPENGVTVSSGQIKVQGRTVPGAEVFVNDSQVAPDKNGDFSAVVALAEGENVIIIVAGNESGDAETEREVFFER